MYLVGFDVNHVPKVIIYIPVQCMLSRNELLLNKHRLKSWFPFVYLRAGRIHVL